MNGAWVQRKAHVDDRLLSDSSYEEHCPYELEGEVACVVPYDVSHVPSCDYEEEEEVKENSVQVSFHCLYVHENNLMICEEEEEEGEEGERVYARYCVY